jgi:hypothetical protein
LTSLVNISSWKIWMSHFTQYTNLNTYITWRFL